MTTTPPQDTKPDAGEIDLGALDGLDDTFETGDTIIADSNGTSGSDSSDPTKLADFPIPEPPTGRPIEFYFDLETVPDQDRFELFEEFLPPLPPRYEACEWDDCPLAEKLLGMSIADMERELVALSPPVEYLQTLAEEEQGRDKPRKGVFELIRKVEAKQAEYEKAFAERLKLLSVTPEFCSIACLGFSFGNDRPVSLDVGSTAERSILDEFWSMVGSVIKTNGRLIGYNILHFDLPVIMARSMILGVEPTCRIDLSPYQSNRDVVDLYLKRFGTRGSNGKQPGGLKALAKLYGIEVPAGDVNGGDVFELMQTPEGQQQVAEYCRSDVHITRELCRRWRGFFV